MTTKATLQCRCVDFQVSDYTDDSFKIKLYGIDDKRETYSILINDFKPFLYIKVGNKWNENKMNEFMKFLYDTSDDNQFKNLLDQEVYEVKLVKHKTLYDFDANKYYNFIYISSNNMKLIYKLKALYYDKEEQKINKGLLFDGTYTKIYETMIPPLLRFFHIQNISPSGWIEVANYHNVPRKLRQTRCDHEIQCKFKSIVSLIEKEDSVPYKICSFDIEASSSHGDFPTAIKNYRKVAYDIIYYMNQRDDQVEEYGVSFMLEKLLKNVFGFENDCAIDKCFLKNKKFTESSFQTIFAKMMEHEIDLDTMDVNKMENSIEKYFDKFNSRGNDHMENDDIDDVNEIVDESNHTIQKSYKKQFKRNNKSNAGNNNLYRIEEIIQNPKYSMQIKVGHFMELLDIYFAKVEIEGDYVTFIGSTFLHYGDDKAYLNHCICLQDTTNVDSSNQEIECYDTEKEVLLAWTNLIQREDPDIIIGYNIFGFDYPFMYDRAKENDCVDAFMKLSRTKRNKSNELSETKIVLASGAYDLRYPNMEGRLQIDVFTYMRKEFTLPSYKLDYVSSYLISDSVKKYTNNLDDNTCTIYTKNMKGITPNCFVHFEIINHSNDVYNNGEKFKVLQISHDHFVIEGHLHGIENEKVQWGLAKDDVTPQDIFRMTNEGPDQKGIIAKYCIQDCNLVHQIFQKIDIMTTYIEMSKICSVPISFLMLRGQGIKLTSYIAKKCREKDTLMPLISKGDDSDMYEGAIVLEPKCGLYLDNPVACVDYSSLYPSSIISENISHDSKVWTKEYDLYDQIIKQTGIVDNKGNFKYDNLPNYKYVDIRYDTYNRDKTLKGYKICRYAQFPNHEKAIMPSILQELLAARKATKKKMAKESDPFMKNILDKRQLSIKVTANSLYGQTGAKTSTFYEMDVAASTTATGRKLLMYAREIIENVYANMRIDTKFGPMLTNAEYIYGDSVAGYTPIYINVDGQYQIMPIDQLGVLFAANRWGRCLDKGREQKEYINLSKRNLYTWTEKGWTRLHTLIRHKLHHSKKMVRVITPTGIVDVTDDHSLLKPDGSCISPKSCAIGDSLLHKQMHHSCIQGCKQIQYAKLITMKHMEFHSQIESSKFINQLNYHRIPFVLDYIDGKYIVDQIEKMDSVEHDKIYKMEYIDKYNDYVYDLTTENHHFAAGIGNMIVHNTDSVFFTFNLKDADTGKPIVGKDALEVTIEMAKEAGHIATKFLKKPHDLEYEKTFLPFCLLSKKRYVGMLYEEDPNYCKRKSMGIVLKRRDNAPIVKDVYGGIIDILMKDKDINKSIEFLNGMLNDIVNQNVKMDKLIISKSLRSFYKNPNQIAHKVLADRMGIRDPGNKPGPGDRIPYVYIWSKKKKELQGNKIEHPEYIQKNKVKIDYGFYISNQIMKPVLQIYSLVLYDMPQFKKKKISFIQKLKTLEQNMEDHDKYVKKVQQLKDKEVKAILFDKYLILNQNKANNNTMITNFFTKK